MLSTMELMIYPTAHKTSSDVGTKVYVSTLYNEKIKVTDSIISSKTGFDGDITKYPHLFARWK